ncbi:MAG: hypothetical protein L6V35_03525 [Alistipes putredinis]|nr:MAG: hypothetical protein L6V35_03525 [Alistipes putredinis]
MKIPCTSIELGSSFETFRVNVSGYTEASSLSVSALGLKKLTIFSSGLQSLNLVGCPDIEDLSVAQMNIEKLDVSMLSKLKTLCVDWCPNLSALDLRGNPELEKFSGSSCSSLKDLDISVNPKLTEPELQRHGYAYDAVHGFVAAHPIHHLRPQHYIYSGADGDSLPLEPA